MLEGARKGQRKGRSFTEEQRERAQERNSERRHNVTEEQRGKELARERKEAQFYWRGTGEGELKK